MSSSEEDTSCPICTEELDITDIHFKPCACGYQVRNEIKNFPNTNQFKQLTFIKT